MNRRRTLVILLVAAGLTGCSSDGPAWDMPDVVGRDLQAAQDAVQHLTAFEVPVSTHDLSGANRTQVVDVDWLVCTQSPDAGAEITPDSMVDLGVVTRAEAC